MKHYNIDKIGTGLTRRYVAYCNGSCTLVRVTSHGRTVAWDMYKPDGTYVERFSSLMSVQGYCTAVNGKS